VSRLRTRFFVMLSPLPPDQDQSSLHAPFFFSLSEVGPLFSLVFLAVSRVARDVFLSALFFL